VDWGISNFHGKSLQACLGRLHGNIPRLEEAILVQVFWDVHTRLLAKGRFKSLSS